jgi:hypothetical protein
VAEIFLVLVAVHLEDVVVRHEIVVDLYGDGPDVILRIVPGDLGFKMAEDTQPPAARVPQKRGARVRGTKGKGT